MDVLAASRQYQENSILTTRPEELTLSLYNGLVKYLMKAELHLQEGNIQQTHENLVRSQDILYEFLRTLDMRYDISEGLAKLYDYMIYRIVEANTKKDLQIIEEVIGFAKELRDTWQEALKSLVNQENEADLALAK